MIRTVGEFLKVIMQEGYRSETRIKVVPEYGTGYDDGEILYLETQQHGDELYLGVVTSIWEE